MATIWMRGPDGERKEVDADPVNVARLMNHGWSQCEAPATAPVKAAPAATKAAEVTEHAD